MADWTEEEMISYEEQTGEHRDSMPEKGISYMYQVVHVRDTEDGRGDGQKWKPDCYFFTQEEALAYKQNMVGLHAISDKIVLVEIQVCENGEHAAEKYRQVILSGLSDVQRSAIGRQPILLEQTQKQSL